jgi:hypothetical protein
MGGVDIANQLRESYEVHRPSFRNWWPLFYWLIDVTIINSYRLYIIYMAELGVEKPLSHKKFRICIITSLFDFAIEGRIQQLRDSLGGKRKFCSTNANIHKVVGIPKPKACTWCSYLVKYHRIKGEEGQDRAYRTSSICSFCDVPLCTRGSNNCWYNYHNIYNN